MAPPLRLVGKPGHRSGSYDSGSYDSGCCGSYDSGSGSYDASCGSYDSGSGSYDSGLYYADSDYDSGSGSGSDSGSGSGSDSGSGSGSGSYDSGSYDSGCGSHDPGSPYTVAIADTVDGSDDRHGDPGECGVVAELGQLGQPAGGQAGAGNHRLRDGGVSGDWVHSDPDCDSHQSGLVGSLGAVGSYGVDAHGSDTVEPDPSRDRRELCCPSA